ncbi:MAG: hypothetical protein GY925_18885 [Actinomycetia bacterium]|nr:hypothetical protein [Actinomycetes bacterium]
MARTTGTTAPATKRALLTALAARTPALTGVDLLYAPSRQGEDYSDDTIWWDPETTCSTQYRWMQAGTKPVKEEWSTSLHIQCLRKPADLSPGEDSAEQAELRVRELWVEVQQAIAETPEIHSTLMWVQVDGWGLVTDRMSGKRARSKLEVDISGVAELYPDP